jgi:adenine-specific DNA-methyltransferase
MVPDIGFRVLKLDDSCVANAKPGELLLDRVKPDRSEEDIVFEMMLKWGMDLAFPVEKTSIAGYPCYSVADDTLICCMKPGLTVDVIEAIAAREPDRVFMLDSVLDDSLKLNALQIFKRVEERTQRKIDLRTV